MASKDLLNEWERDFFEQYEASVDEEGMVNIEATCPEGEVMRVFVEKKRAPPGKTPPPKAAVASGSTTQPGALAPKYVWIVMRTDYDHHTDEEGRSSVACSTAYDSLKQANEAARDLLLEACGVEDGEDSLPEMNESNVGSDTEPYIGYAYVRWDDIDNIEMKVTRMELHCRVKTHACGGQKRTAEAEAGGARKKAKKTDSAKHTDIIDLT